MLALAQHGIHVVPLSLERPDEPIIHAQAAELAQRALYPPGALAGRSLAAQLLMALRHPAGQMWALRIAATHGLRAPAHAGEFASSLLAASYFAVKLGRSVRHVHAHGTARPATVGWLLAEMLGCGYSLSFQGREIFIRDAIALPMKLAEAEFATVSSVQARERVLRSHRLVAGGKVHLVYRGVDLNQLAPRPEPNLKPPVILSVGRLVERKGYPFLLRAASLLRARGVDFRLIIAGDGPERQDLLRMRAGLGLQGVVEFRAALSQEQLMGLYHEAHTFALASVVATDGDRDGLPDVLAEALAMGIPTVASDISAIPELIEPEQTGLLARPGDARDLADKLEMALYDEEVRERVSRLGHEKVCTYFDVDRNTAALAELFAEAM